MCQKCVSLTFRDSALYVVIHVVHFGEIWPSLSFFNLFCVLYYEMDWLHVWSHWLNQFDCVCSLKVNGILK